MDQSNHTGTIPLCFVTSTMLGRSGIGVSRGSGVASSIWMADGDVEELLAKLSWAKRAYVKPGLFQWCG